MIHRRGCSRRLSSSAVLLSLTCILIAAASGGCWAFPPSRSAPSPPANTAMLLSSVGPAFPRPRRAPPLPYIRNDAHRIKKSCPAATRPPVLLRAGGTDESDEADRSGSETTTTTKNDDDGNHNKDKPTVAIVGSGAVGCYYGARLHETGRYTVKFLMRGEHYAASKRDGLSVTSSVGGDVFIPPDTIRAFDDPAEVGTVDWVLLCLKSTSLGAAPKLVRPLLRDDTRVLAIMNGLIDEDLVNLLEDDAPLDEEHRHNPPPGVAAARPPLTCCAAVYGGMALVCSNRLGPGLVHHSYAGKLTGALSASSNSAYSRGGEGNQDADRQALLDLWSPTSIEFVYENDLVRGRWSKNCWNLPFNGISVAMGGITVDRIVTDPGLRRLADIVMDEAIAVGNADLEARGADPSTFLGQAEKDAMMTLSDNMGPYKPSTMLDFHSRKPMEVKYLFRKAVDRANRLNVPVPHLETLVSQIEAFQRMYDLY